MGWVKLCSGIVLYGADRRGKADGARSGNDWIGTVWTGEVCEVWQIWH